MVHVGEVEGGGRLADAAGDTADVKARPANLGDRVLPVADKEGGYELLPCYSKCSFQ